MNDLHVGRSEPAVGRVGPDTRRPAGSRWYAVVLHWGRVEDTAACLASLEPLGFDSVLLVDNGTGVAALDGLVGGAVRTKLVRRPTNGGYAAGNNDGLRIACAEGAEFVVVVNNDVTVEYPAMLDDAEAAFRQCGALGVLSPAVLIKTPRWVEEPVSSRLQEELLGHADGSDIIRIDNLPVWVRRTPAFAGCCWMVPIRVLSEVGPMREDLFLYYEELDFAMRLRRAGYVCGRLGVKDGHVRHHGGTENGLSPVQAYYCGRNLVALLDGFSPTLRRHLLATVSLSVAKMTLRCAAAARLRSALQCVRGFTDGLRGCRGERQPHEAPGSS